MMLLYGLFNSVRDSLLALSGIPFAVAGGILGLTFAGLNFSVSAAVGFISLFGVAVLDGVLLVTYFNQLRMTGMSLSDAVHQGAQVRLRPVLMTALLAIFGFLPAALSHGIGAEVQRPLAIVVIGGLVSSTMLTLLVLPAGYIWLYSRRAARAETKV